MLRGLIIYKKSSNISSLCPLSFVSRSVRRSRQGGAARPVAPAPSRCSGARRCAAPPPKVWLFCPPCFQPPPLHFLRSRKHISLGDRFHDGRRWRLPVVLPVDWLTGFQPSAAAEGMMRQRPVALSFSGLSR